MKIRCEKAEDRDSLVMILARNGYVVWIERERIGKTSRSAWFVCTCEDTDIGIILGQANNGAQVTEEAAGRMRRGEAS